VRLGRVNRTTIASGTKHKNYWTTYFEHAISTPHHFQYRLISQRMTTVVRCVDFHLSRWQAVYATTHTADAIKKRIYEKIDKLWFGARGNSFDDSPFLHIGQDDQFRIGNPIKTSLRSHLRDNSPAVFGVACNNVFVYRYIQLKS